MKNGNCAICACTLLKLVIVGHLAEIWSTIYSFASLTRTASVNFPFDRRLSSIVYCHFRTLMNLLPSHKLMSMVFNLLSAQQCAEQLNAIYIILNVQVAKSCPMLASSPAVYSAYMLLFGPLFSQHKYLHNNNAVRTTHISNKHAPLFSTALTIKNV